MTTALSILVVCLFMLLFASAVSWIRARVKPWVYTLGGTVWCAVWFVADIFAHDQVFAAIMALMGSLFLYDFWRKKPPFNRKKVKKLVGAKAKAIKAKVVAAMPKASPVGKPALVPTSV